MAFGADDVLYRRGCDRLIYSKQEYEWMLLSDMEASTMSASKDALYIAEKHSKMPYKFDTRSGEFKQIGNRKVDMLAAGVSNHVVMEGRNQNFRFGGIYGWVETDNAWRNLGGGSVDWLASGYQGRLYKVAYPSLKVF